MRKLLVLFSALLVAGIIAVIVLVVMNPFSSSNTGNAINTNPSFIRDGTLQGKIMDALTGAAIGGEGLEVYLIQGTDMHKPDKLIKDTNDPLVGEYAFNSIPVGVVANQLSFKLVVIKDGYQRFESNISIQATFAGNISNEVFNTIGNIYLYPLGSSAGDVTIYVYSPQNTPIANATVLLQQDVTNNNTISYTGNRLVAAAGLYPSLTATTDSSGKAVFSSTDLTLGGSYSVVVEALTFEGQQLATATSASFITGVNSTTRVVNMASIGNSLFATSASNSIPGSIKADGVLTITFNQPILLSTRDFTATMSDGTLSSSTVRGVLSNSNMTLTLTPTITTAPTAKGATITYTFGGVIYLQSSQTTTTYTLFTGGGTDVMNIATGNAVSGVVQMTSK